MTPSNFLPAPTGPHGRAVPWTCVLRNKNARLILPGNHSEYQNIVPSVSLINKDVRVYHSFLVLFFILDDSDQEQSLMKYLDKHGILYFNL